MTVALNIMMAGSLTGANFNPDRLAGVDDDYHTRDLYEAIERGNHPSWTLRMQIMPFDEAKTTSRRSAEKSGSSSKRL